MRSPSPRKTFKPIWLFSPTFPIPFERRLPLVLLVPEIGTLLVFLSILPIENLVVTLCLPSLKTLPILSRRKRFPIHRGELQIFRLPRKCAPTNPIMILQILLPLFRRGPDPRRFGFVCGIWSPSRTDPIPWRLCPWGGFDSPIRRIGRLGFGK